MSLLLAAGIVAGVGALTKTGIGLYENIRGRREYNRLLGNAPKYDYQMPASYGLATSMAARGYYAGNNLLDTERYLAGATSRSVDVLNRYATSSQQMVSGIEQIYAQELENLNKAALNDIQRKDVARSQYIQALVAQGNAELQQNEKKFEYNQWLPWQMRMNVASSRMNMGRGMLYGGMSDLFGGATNVLLGAYQSSEMARLYGGVNANIPKSNTSTQSFNPTKTWDEAFKEYVNNIKIGI